MECTRAWDSTMELAKACQAIHLLGPTVVMTVIPAHIAQGILTSVGIVVLKDLSVVFCSETASQLVCTLLLGLPSSFDK
eukprot:scaffold12299_cov85-Cyclotella_meneghiniana.AAC.8